MTRFGGSRGELHAHVERELNNATASVMRIELQPIVDLQSGRVVGEEALSRIDLSAGAVRPDHWFEAGRELSLTTAAALESRAANPAIDAARWGSGVLSVNFSPDTLLSPEVGAALDRLQAFASETGRPVAIELSEKGHLHDAAQVHDMVLGLRRRNFLIAIDDAGTGYAHEAFVQQVLSDRWSDADYSVVKIDASHADIRRGSNERFVRRFAAIAAEHRADMVVEGISSREVLAAVKGLQADFGNSMTIYGQGHWLSRNLTGPDAPTLVAPVAVGSRSVGMERGTPPI